MPRPLPRVDPHPLPLTACTDVELGLKGVSLSEESVSLLTYIKCNVVAIMVVVICSINGCDFLYTYV